MNLLKIIEELREERACLDEVLIGRGVFSSRGVHGRRPPRYSETFDHPDIAVGDVASFCTL